METTQSLKEFLKKHYPSGLVQGNVKFKMSMNHSMIFPNIINDKIVDTLCLYGPSDDCYDSYSVYKWNETGVIPCEKIIKPTTATIPFFKISHYMIRY